VLNLVFGDSSASEFGTVMLGREWLAITIDPSRSVTNQKDDSRPPRGSRPPPSCRWRRNSPRKAMADAAMAMDAHAMRNVASRVYGERTCVSRRGGRGEDGTRA